MSEEYNSVFSLTTEADTDILVRPKHWPDISVYLYIQLVDKLSEIVIFSYI